MFNIGATVVDNLTRINLIHFDTNQKCLNKINKIRASKTFFSNYFNIKKAENYNLKVIMHLKILFPYTKQNIVNIKTL